MDCVRIMRWEGEECEVPWDEHELQNSTCIHCGLRIEDDIGIQANRESD